MNSFFVSLIESEKKRKKLGFPSFFLNQKRGRMRDMMELHFDPKVGVMFFAGNLFITADFLLEVGDIRWKISISIPNSSLFKTKEEVNSYLLKMNFKGKNLFLRIEDKIVPGIWSLI
jgi:hypothetical protein